MRGFVAIFILATKLPIPLATIAILQIISTFALIPFARTYAVAPIKGGVDK